MGVKKLRKIQLGRETTAGTEVNASTLWRGTGVVVDNAPVERPEEDVGLLVAPIRTYIPYEEAALTMDETPLTFEQVLHIFEAGIKTDTPSQDGTGSGYIYDYAFPTTAEAALKTYTIEGGDDTQEEQFLYAYVTGFTISGRAQEACMMSADWIGRQVATGTYTGGVSIPSVEEVLFQKVKLYIDASGGTIGTTQKTSTLREFNLSVVTGWIPKYTGDGELYFAYHEMVGPTAECSFVYEHNSTAVTEKAAAKAETTRLIRLAFEGSTFTTAGTSYSVKTLYLDMAGTYNPADGLGDDAGNDTVSMTFYVGYSSSDTLSFAAKVVTNLSAVP